MSSQPLTPLTSDPAQWMDIADHGVPSWQSRLNPEAFSTDGGVTYYLRPEREAVGMTATLRRSLRRSAEPV